MKISIHSFICKCITNAYISFSQMKQTVSCDGVKRYFMNCFKMIPGFSKMKKKKILSRNGEIVLQMDGANRWTLDRTNM